MFNDLRNNDLEYMEKMRKTLQTANILERFFIGKLCKKVPWKDLDSKEYLQVDVSAEELYLDLFSYI